MATPEGIFGVPHGVLSSTDEWVALFVGLVALVAAVLYDGELDLRPVSGAAAVGVFVALFGSIVAPAPVTEEWHIPVGVVVVVLGGFLIAARRTRS